MQESEGEILEEIPGDISVKHLENAFTNAWIPGKLLK